MRQFVITGNRQGFDKAQHFFSTVKEAYLDDAAIADSVEIAPLERASLYVNEQESRKIAAYFAALISSDQPRHVYMDTKALGDEIEIIISYKEYDDLF